MSGKEDKFNGVVIGSYNNQKGKLVNDLRKHIKGDVIFFCVGTDRNTGDSFAPYVGTLLEDKGYTNVIGTIDDPVHALNLEERIKEIPKDKTVIAIDAALGRLTSVNTLKLNTGALYAGAGVGKDLSPVGDYHIHGIVNVNADSHNFNQMVLQNTRFKVVMNLAKQLVAAIEEAYPLHNEIINNTYIKAVQ
jgi:putative sporulation protein YyaC